MLDLARLIMADSENKGRWRAAVLGERFDRGLYDAVDVIVDATAGLSRLPSDFRDESMASAAEGVHAAYDSGALLL